MIHIVFNEPDVEVITKAIELDPSMEGQVLVINDDYAVGPLSNIFTPEGSSIRKEWWRVVLQGTEMESSLDEGRVNDHETVTSIKELLANNPEEFVWIWAAQNKHDVCGYYWLVSQFSAFQGRVYILYLNNLPFISEKGTIFYPEWLSQIPAKEFVKAKKLARLVTTSEFEVDADEWNKICEAESLVRLLEGGKKIVHGAVHYYDTELSKYITHDSQKAGKIINGFLTKSKETTGDMFLLWRLKQIVQGEAFEVSGELKGIKDFEVKKKSAVSAAE